MVFQIIPALMGATIYSLAMTPYMIVHVALTTPFLYIAIFVSLSCWAWVVYEDSQGWLHNPDAPKYEPIHIILDDPMNEVPPLSQRNQRRRRLGHRPEESTAIVLR